MRLLMSFLFVSSFSIYARRVVKGNAEDENTTCSFSMGPCVADLMRHDAEQVVGFYFGAGKGAAGKCKEYALSCLKSDHGELVPLAPEKIIMNHGKELEDNPLYDKQIRCLDILKGNETFVGNYHRPAVVIEDDPSTLYLLNSMCAGRGHLLSASSLPDARGGITSGVVGLEDECALRKRPDESLAMVGHSIFYAAAPTNGSFGDPGSGIGRSLLFFVDADSEFSKQHDGRTDFFSPVLLPVPLDRCSPLLKCGEADLKEMSFGDMYWDPVLARLFIGLHVTTGKGGGRSVVVGHIEGYETSECTHALVLEPIATPELFSRPGGVVGTLKEGEQVSAHKVSVLHTSTARQYLVVQGGIGDSECTQRMVYAVPLRIGSDVHTHGKPTCHHSDKGNPKAVPVVCDIPAYSDNMVCVSDTGMLVGGGSLPHGPISSMLVRGDFVLVMVLEPFVGHESGIYFSQARFNNEGYVSGWSSWQSVTNMGFIVDNIGPIQAISRGSIASDKVNFNIDDASMAVAQIVKQILTS